MTRVRRHDPETLSQIIELRRTIKSPTAIAKQVGLRVSQVEGILRNLRRYTQKLEFEKEQKKETPPEIREPSRFAEEMGIEKIVWKTKERTASTSSSQNTFVNISLARVKFMEKVLVDDC